jgi:hypothetical protein
MKCGAVPFLIFEVSYVLPIPFWVYAYSCMAVLVVSFAALGYFFATPVAGTVPLSADAKSKWFSGTVGAPTLALYVGIYLSVVATAKRMAGTKIGVGELALRFTYSLIPIAFVYNVTHYFTFLITQIRALPWLITDPFGFGWNLLHISAVPPERAPLAMGIIWHTEVALILSGHLVSICVAHMISLKIFSSRRQALLNQIPMLVLMIIYTSTGLLILSLHLSQRITSAGG